MQNFEIFQVLPKIRIFLIDNAFFSYTNKIASVEEKREKERSLSLKF